MAWQQAAAHTRGAGCHGFPAECRAVLPATRRLTVREKGRGTAECGQQPAPAASSSLRLSARFLGKQQNFFSLALHQQRRTSSVKDLEGASVPASSASLPALGALERRGKLAGTWMAAGWRLAACKAQDDAGGAAATPPEGLRSALTLQLLVPEASDAFFLFTYKLTSSFQSQRQLPRLRVWTYSGQ